MLLRSVLSFATPLVILACAAAQDGPPRREERGGRPERPEGLLKREPGAYEGLTLVSSLSTRETHLIDLEGRSVHRWKSDVPLGNVAYLMADGTLLRAGRQGDNKIFRGGGEGGRIQKLDV
ncbi:MAG: hypothetical protein JNM84_14600, partial [Planctomycetes bacterium]|nr:hypothetical protein [Planctomycetota bacterium]